ncbi:MAG: Bax inhibitor-1/YccA family protein [Rhodobacteraceae bacterium]|nr:Bax inhibitor-1/YccA family protein [Paracoccaceae bacterium]MCY4136724.1 Bax inhibitor-1/YccA family protein [Paracoccaceae bacterium]
MAENQAFRRVGAGVVRTAVIDEGLRAHMNKVYALMSIAMIITGMVAYVVGSDLGRAMSGQPTLIVPPELLQLMFGSAFRWVIIFAPLGVVFLFSATIARMSWSTAQTVFWVFAGLMGLSLSTIFAIYTGISIAQTFFVTAIAFASLSLWGYTTKKDISGWGSFLFMGVIGLIVASVLNIFIASSALHFAVTVIGLLVFAGLTAYDTQKIKNTYLQMAGTGNTEWLEKSAIMGALGLYINFINMFVLLLQIFGQRE